MQIRFYDSELPGPPNGWLDRDQGLPVQERAVWNHVVAAIRATTRGLAKSVSGNEPVQFWGGLRLDDLWWVYRSIPSDVGRAGRTFAVFFCSKGINRFDWTSIEALAPELEALVSDPNHSASLMRSLDKSQSRALLTDDLLRQPSTPLLDAVKSEMSRLLNGLVEGGHEYFTISVNGNISKREQENIVSKPPPTSQPPAKMAPAKVPVPDKASLMKKFISHALALVIGLLLGFGLHGGSSPKTPIEKIRKNQPGFHSDEDALAHLREATNYLEQSLKRARESLPPAEPQTQPQRLPSPPQNHRNDP